MSNRRDDVLLDALLTSDVVAAAVEDQLDRHPVPVDEEAVRRVTDRVWVRINAHARVAPPRWRPVRLGLAAVALLLARVDPAPISSVVTSGDDLEGVAPAVAPDVPEQVRLNQSGRLELPRVGRSVTLGEGARALTSETDDAAVLLLQSGRAVADDGAEIAARHWAILPPRAPTVVFADGTPPPADGSWPADVDRQLRALRWAALPPRTLDTLDELLEER